MIAGGDSKEARLAALAELYDEIWDWAHTSTWLTRSSGAISDARRPHPVTCYALRPETQDDGPMSDALEVLTG